MRWPVEDVEELSPFTHLYLHIPFCRHKCGYCDFNAYAGMGRLMEPYVEALISELGDAKRRLPFVPLQTVYLGGGTPSLLSAQLMTSLLAAVHRIFDIQEGAEVTLEANPLSTDEQRLAAWRESGVNRISLGVQGFDPRALAVLERRTDGAQALRAYREARSAGFDNISLDLIYAVPDQEVARWEHTMSRAIELAPEHLSCYCLSFEEGTLLHRRLREGRIASVDADLQWQLLDLACGRLAAAGYERYEVSNWARSGRYSRHNRAYWDCRPVYGAGAGAHSYASGPERAWRWWNIARPQEYIGATPTVVEDFEVLEASAARAEAVMLGLRTQWGVDSERLPEPVLIHLLSSGLAQRAGNRVLPTRRGLDLHNQVAVAVL